MKYVIDTSVEIKTFVQECDSGKAVRLRNEYHQGVHELIAPGTFPTEMGNVLMVLVVHCSSIDAVPAQRHSPDLWFKLAG
jgi:hypothetical protein